MSAEEAKAYAEENAMQYIEASAKTSHNVNEVFESIAAHLPNVMQNTGAK